MITYVNLSNYHKKVLSFQSNYFMSRYSKTPDFRTYKSPFKTWFVKSRVTNVGRIHPLEWGVKRTEIPSWTSLFGMVGERRGPRPPLGPDYQFNPPLHSSHRVRENPGVSLTSGRSKGWAALEPSCRNSTRPGPRPRVHGLSLSPLTVGRNTDVWSGSKRSGWNSDCVNCKTRGRQT